MNSPHMKYFYTVKQNKKLNRQDQTRVKLKLQHICNLQNIRTDLKVGFKFLDILPSCSHQPLAKYTIPQLMPSLAQQHYLQLFYIDLVTYRYFDTLWYTLVHFGKPYKLPYKIWSFQIQKWLNHQVQKSTLILKSNNYAISFCNSGLNISHLA